MPLLNLYFIAITLGATDAAPSVIMQTRISNYVNSTLRIYAFTIDESLKISGISSSACSAAAAWASRAIFSVW